MESCCLHRCFHSLPVFYVRITTSPGDDLLEVILKYDLTDILLNRNEFGGFQITGTHNGVPTFGGIVAPGSG